MQVPREASRQSHRKPWSVRRPTEGRSSQHVAPPARRAFRVGADTGALGGWRLRPMSFVWPDCFPWVSKAHAARAPATPAAKATPARVTPARAASTAEGTGGTRGMGSAGGRRLSDASIQRSESGLFHVEHDGPGQPAPRTGLAEPGSGTVTLANRPGARTGRPGVPSGCARLPAQRAHHARRPRP
jgi:hypothetical protein